MERPKGTPRDVFMYLLAMIALYMSTCSVITLLFQYINIVLPDALDSEFFRSATIRWSLADLIILFPVYLWSSSVLEGEVVLDPEKGQLRIRKWMLNLTLFLAGLLILGDLISLIYKFLGGELTARFVLKVLSILVVAGAIFAYYRDALRRTAGEPPTGGKTVAIAASIVVAAIVIVGVLAAGSPFRARLMAFDEKKVSDLNSIQWRIIDYWKAKGRLPASLGDLTDNIAGFTAPVDPQSHRPYGYRVTGPRNFELCADFNLPSEKSEVGLEGMQRRYGPFVANWAHAAGLVCFKRDIDPTRYRPNLPPAGATAAPPLAAPMPSSTASAAPPR